MFSSCLRGFLPQSTDMLVSLTGNSKLDAGVHVSNPKTARFSERECTGLSEHDFTRHRLIDVPWKCLGTTVGGVTQFHPRVSCGLQTLLCSTFWILHFVFRHFSMCTLYNPFLIQPNVPALWKRLEHVD